MKTPESGPQREVLTPGTLPRLVGRPGVPPDTKSAEKIRPAVAMKHYSEFAGAGCLLQAVGLLAPVVGLLGGLLGLMIGCFVCLVLVVVGSQQSVSLLCGHCGNRVDNRHVTLCPSCKGKLFYKRKSLIGFAVFVLVALAIIVWSNWMSRL